jgi:hypothetical protein
MADNLLRYLFEHFPVEEFVDAADLKKILTDTGLEYNELNAFLAEFERMGFISHYCLHKVHVDLMVTQSLDKFVEMGGFSGELSKLKIELELLNAQLKKPIADNADKITSIASNALSLISTISAFLGKY